MTKYSAFNKKTLILIFLITIFTVATFNVVSACQSCDEANNEQSPGLVGMKNPAAVYCTELGYEYKVIQTEQGERGVCIFQENGTEYDAWDFLEGKVGQEYSYCARIGCDTETLIDGKNLFSSDYAVCIPKQQSGFVSNAVQSTESMSVTDLMNLREKVCVGAFHITTPEKESFNTQNTMINFDVETPSSFDWRDKDGENWITPVRCQGCGDCWAFGAIAGVEAKYNIVMNDSNFDVNLAEQYLVSDCFGYGDCSGISTINNYALEYIRDHGITDETCYPYAASNSLCSDRCSTWNRRLWTIDDVGRDIPDEEIQAHLIEKGPLSTYIGMNGSWVNDIYTCNGYFARGHVILLVGYNDTGDYWIAKNSWGTGFGDNGYFKVGYDQCYINFLDSPFYVDLTKETSIKNVKANNVEVSIGSRSGTLSDTYYKDGDYMSLSEQCSFPNCNGLNATLDFPLDDVHRVESMNLVAYHRGYSENGFTLSFWNENNSQWNSLGSVPNTNWYQMKYKICDSTEECSDYLNSGSFSMKYYHHPCSMCNTDYVDVDWLYLELVDYIPAPVPLPTSFQRPEPIPLPAYMQIPTAVPIPDFGIIPSPIPPLFSQCFNL